MGLELLLKSANQVPTHNKFLLFAPFSTMAGGLFWIDADIKKQTLDALKKGKIFEPATIIDKQFKVE